jgi:hypothetical protein
MKQLDHMREHGIIGGPSFGEVVPHTCNLSLAPFSFPILVQISFSFLKSRLLSMQCMQDANISDDLWQLAHGQVKALEYSPYNINRYHFWTAKLEVSHPLAATSNSGVVTSVEYGSGVSADYYGILQKNIEHTFGGTKEPKVVFLNVIDLIQ